MKDYDMNNGFDNMNRNDRASENNEAAENNNVNEVPAENAESRENAQNNDTIHAVNDAPANAPMNQSAPQNPGNTAYNPYFQGYGQQNPRQEPAQPDYQAQAHQREYPYQGLNGQQMNNPQMNRQNPYQQQYTGYNAYAPQNQQPHSQQYSQGQISYAPTAEKKKKQKKSASTGVVAVICAAAVVLSGLSGFGGAMLANRITDKGNASNVSESAGNSTVSDQGGVDEPVVIYRSVDEVETTTSTDGENLTYSQVAAIVKNSVVEIVTEFNVQSGWYQYVTQGAGSGVIISTDGYIITNTHVITDESTGVPSDQITVRLADGTEYPAKTIGYDADSDISIIKIEATGLTAAQCGDSDKLSVGEELVIVGNPLGELGGTVTNGIVSATEREIQVNSVTMSLIQTNAAVNPGNSGGGMFNMKGQLVGIVNAKSSGSDIEGLGFAIPINEALDVSKQLLEFGYVRGKVMIGVTFEEVSGSNYFFYYNIEPGLYVTALTKGYNDQVLKVGDRVVAVNGETVSAVADIKAIVSASTVGDKIKFQVERDGKLTELEVTCYEQVPAELSQSEDITFEEEPAESEQTWSQQSPYSYSFPDIFGNFFGGGH
ncbi:MAG: trypsin-like peptidase domain-containing protein [Clostridia bacterium]|nr:trypsin-like peptidase domain-containing protein [Clostridia bacterium]